jgi:hypothetical protein
VHTRIATGAGIMIVSSPRLLDTLPLPRQF